MLALMTNKTFLSRDCLRHELDLGVKSYRQKKEYYLAQSVDYCIQIQSEEQAKLPFISH